MREKVETVRIKSPLPSTYNYSESSQPAPATVATTSCDCRPMRVWNATRCIGGSTGCMRCICDATCRCYCGVPTVIALHQMVLPNQSLIIFIQATVAVVLCLQATDKFIIIRHPVLVSHMLRCRAVDFPLCTTMWVVTEVTLYYIQWGVSCRESPWILRRNIVNVEV